jgi:hypothetical protein
MLATLKVRSSVVRSVLMLIYPAAVLPLLAAKQRKTHENDWMSSDALIACPDPNCPSVLRITRTEERVFSRADTTVVAKEGNGSSIEAVRSRVDN